MAKVVDKNQKRKEILKAAMRVFGEKGVADTKMNDVAVAAGIGKGTIYEYFQNREDLLCESFEYLLRKIKALMLSRIDIALSPEEKIRTGFLAYLDVATLEIEEFAEILLDFWAYSIRQKEKGINLTLDISSRYREYRELTIPILEEGVRTGVFRDMDTEVVASALIAACDGLLLQWLADKGNFNLQKAAELTLNILLQGIAVPS